MVISRDFRSFDELGRPFRPRRQAATKIRFLWKCSVASNRIIRRVSQWIYPIRVRCKCSYLWNLTSPFRERFRVRALGFPDAQPLTFQKDAGPHPQYFFFAVANKRDICIWYRRPRIRKIHFMKWAPARAGGRLYYCKNIVRKLFPHSRQRPSAREIPAIRWCSIKKNCLCQIIISYTPHCKINFAL